MDMQNYREQFLIFIVESDDKIRQLFEEILSRRGYAVYGYSTAEHALKALPELLPHIIFCASELTDEKGLKVLEEVRKASTDIEVIFMPTSRDRTLAFKAIEAGAYDILYTPVDDISEVLAWADRAAEHVYLKLENEQLHQELNQAGRKTLPPEMGTFLDKVTKATDAKEVIQVMVDQVSRVANHKPAIFLKYIPAYTSIAVAAASQIPWDNVKSVGIPLTDREPKSIEGLLKNPETFTELQELMTEVFKCSQYTCFLVGMNESPGLLVVFDSLNEEIKTECMEFVKAGNFGYENAIMKTRLSDLAIKDPVTGLFNRRYFNEKLEEELNRSRRTRYPLSIISIDIDHLKKYNDQNGQAMGDVIVQTVAQIIQKSSRKTDIPVRLGGEEFAILCPHTPAVGAAVKAEKIRLTISGTKFPYGDKQPGGAISISMGVSEYPTIAGDATLLIKSSEDALYRVKQGGRNRVCLAEPPQGFRPDFDPLPVPGYQSLPPTSSQPSSTHSPDVIS